MPAGRISFGFQWLRSWRRQRLALAPHEEYGIPFRRSGCILDVLGRVRSLTVACARVLACASTLAHALKEYSFERASCFSLVSEFKASITPILFRGRRHA